MNEAAAPGDRSFRILSAARLDGPPLDELRKVARIDLVGAALGHSMGSDELVRLVSRYDVLLVETEPVTDSVLRSGTRLMAVGCCRGDPVNVDVRAAAARGIPVLFAPGRNADATADLAFGLLLSQVRNIARTHHLLVSGVLTVPRTDLTHRSRRDTIWALPDGSLPSRKFGGPELRDLVLGIIGCGRVGRAVAIRATAFGMRVIGFDPYLSRPPEHIPLASLDEVLAQSDVVSIHCKLTAETTGLIGRSEIAEMRPGAILINTARALIVDEAALVEALQQRRLGGAGLDVFVDEPLPNDSPFLSLDNVTLTPHLGGASSSVVRRHSEIVLGDVMRLLRGEAPLNVYRLPE